MNSSDLSIYLDTLGRTGKAIRLVNWLAPWSLIFAGFLGVVGGYAGLLFFLAICMPLIALTVLVNILTLIAYWANNRWTNWLPKGFIALVIIASIIYIIGVVFNLW